MSKGVISERSAVGAGLAAVVLAVLGWAATPADGRTAWQECDQGRLSCARVSAPLDPTGRVPGRVSLFVERYAVAEHPTATLVVLPGGPGQSAVALFGRFRHDFRDLLGSRALVMFDERGIGRSGRLDCRVPAGTSLAGAQITACAKSLGGRASLYSSDHTAADLEAIRRSLGLGRIDLYGVSYGTFPATQYVRRYPSNVAHLVLDSTLPADGDQAVSLSSFASVRRQLATICAVVCRNLDPPADLVRFLGRLPRRPSPARPGRLAIDRDNAGRVILNALDAADLDPFVRASIPAALRLAAGGETSAIVRLGDIAVASEQAAAAVATNRPSAGPHPRTVAVDVVPIATRCADERLPWSRRDSLARRQALVGRAQSRLSAAAVAPFTPAVAFAGAVIADCERWPSAGGDPSREAGPLPSLPTLILSGAGDVRTPLEQADGLAAQIPGAAVLAVPGVGHAVLADDHTGCARRAVAAFLTAAPVIACRAGTPPPVDPLPPGPLAALAPAAGLIGEPGEVLAASVLTLRHEVGLVSPYLVAGLAVAGTAAGGLIDRVIGGRRVVELHRISYVGSVSLTGSLTAGRGGGFSTGRLAVKVSGRPYGTLRLGASGTIAGVVGGIAFKLRVAERQAIDTAHGLDFATKLR